MRESESNPRDTAADEVWTAGAPGLTGVLQAQHHLLAVAFGPNGSGRTTGLVVPDVLDWDGPVVFTTATPQDLEPVCSARTARGQSG